MPTIMHILMNFHLTHNETTTIVYTHVTYMVSPDEIQHGHPWPW